MVLLEPHLYASSTHSTLPELGKLLIYFSHIFIIEVIHIIIDIILSRNYNSINKQFNLILVTSYICI